MYSVICSGIHLKSNLPNTAQEGDQESGNTSENSSDELNVMRQGSKTKHTAHETKDCKNKTGSTLTQELHAETGINKQGHKS